MCEAREGVKGGKLMKEVIVKHQLLQLLTAIHHLKNQIITVFAFSKSAVWYGLLEQVVPTHT